MGKCRKFQPNLFNKTRCQNCFGAKDAHGPEAFETVKACRKLTNCGFLYIAPENIDFSIATQRNKRWQRRWFCLYDDGELTWALDQHPDTIPHGRLDLTYCTEVTSADAVTQHANSVAIAVGDERRFVKADTADEIRWWHQVLSMYPKQYAVHRSTARRSFKAPEKDSFNGWQNEPRQEGGSGSTVVEVKSPTPQHVQHVHVEPDASAAGATPSDRPRKKSRRTSDPLSAAKIDVSRVGEGTHGTPRSVKARKTSKTAAQPSSASPALAGDRSERRRSNRRRSARSMSDLTDSRRDIVAAVSKHQAEILNAATRVDTASAEPELPSPAPSLPTRTEPSTLPDTANDTSKPGSSQSLNHTLRKGWLMLRGQDENDWNKHWCVLAGLSLSLYKDPWAEDGGHPSIDLDLTDCCSASAVEATKHYGIMLQWRSGDPTILSAMTPGIRNSWIRAIQQNIQNPSPVSPAVERRVMPRQSPNRRKHIAYVAPESHREASSGLESSSEDDAANSLLSGSRDDLLSHSERSSHLTDDDLTSGTSTPMRSISPSASTGSRQGAHDTVRSRRRRRRSSPPPSTSNASAGAASEMSPTYRRSPVARVKQRSRHAVARDGERSQRSVRSPRPERPRRERDDGVSTVEISYQRRTSSVDETGESDSEQMIPVLQAQLESLRDELARVQNRLSDSGKGSPKTAKKRREQREEPSLTNGHSQPESVPSSHSRHHTHVTHIPTSPTTPRPPDALPASSQSTSLNFEPGRPSTTASNEMERLRASLLDAESSIHEKQAEIEQLREKLDLSVHELSDTETALSASLQGLQKEKARFASISRDWSRRVHEMESQLQGAVHRLETRQKEIELKSEQLAEMQTLQRKHEQMMGQLRTLNEQLVRYEQSDERGRLTTDLSPADVESKIEENEGQVQTLLDRANELTELREIHVSFPEETESQLPSPEVDGTALEELTQNYSRFLTHLLNSHGPNLDTANVASLQSTLATIESDSGTSHWRDVIKCADWLTSLLQSLPPANHVPEQNAIANHVEEQPNRVMTDSCTSTERSATESFETAPQWSEQYIKEVEAYQVEIANLKDQVESLTCDLNGGSENATTISSDLGTPQDQGTHEFPHPHGEKPHNGSSPSDDPHTPPEKDGTAAFMWNYPLAPLHSDLASNLSVYLSQKYIDLETTSDELDVTELLVATAAVELAMTSEIANVLESTTQDMDRLDLAVLLRDIRTVYVIYRKLESLMDTIRLQNDQLTLEKLRLFPVNFFSLYSESLGNFLTAQFAYAYGRSQDPARRTTKCSDDNRCKAARSIIDSLGIVDYARNSNVKEAILGIELQHELARIEAVSKAGGTNEPVHPIDPDNLAQELSSVKRLRSSLMGYCDSMYLEIVDDNATASGSLKEALRAAVSDRLRQLSELNQQAGDEEDQFAPAVKFRIIEHETIAELSSLIEKQLSWSQEAVPQLALLVCIKGCVVGLSRWLEGVLEGKQLSMSPPKSKDKSREKLENQLDMILSVERSTNTNPEAVRLAANFKAGIDLDNCIRHYGPLSRNLVYAGVTSAVVKIALITAAIDHQAILYEMEETIDGLRKDVDPERVESLQRSLRSIENDKVALENELSGRMTKMTALAHELDRSKESMLFWQRKAEEKSEDSNLLNEFRDLEQEMVDLQAQHAEELSTMKSSYHRRLDQIQKRLDSESEMRRKAQSDLMAMRTMNDQSLSLMEKTHQQILAQLRKEQDEAVDQVARRYEELLQEEKEATKQALDCLRKAHEEELMQLTEKLKLPRDGASPKSYSEALELVRKELTELSNSYCNKCIENSKLDEELSRYKRRLEEITGDTDVSLSPSVHASSSGSFVTSILDSHPVNGVPNGIDGHDRHPSPVASVQSSDSNLLYNNTFAPIPEGPSVLNGWTNAQDTPKEWSPGGISSDSLNSAAMKEATPPKNVRRGRVNARRGDPRFHSSPALDSESDYTVSATSEELQILVGMPVSERRKFFENSYSSHC